MMRSMRLVCTSQYIPKNPPRQIADPPDLPITSTYAKRRRPRHGPSRGWQSKVYSYFLSNIV